MIAYVNDYACFFCESHMQNEQFNSDRQAVDRFGSKVFLFWFFFWLLSIHSFMSLTNFTRRDWYGDLGLWRDVKCGLMKWLS